MWGAFTYPYMVAFILSKRQIYLWSLLTLKIMSPRGISRGISTDTPHWHIDMAALPYWQHMGAETAM